MNSNSSAGLVAIAVATAFARPADTTAYAAGDLVANSVTAGSVVPLEFQFVTERARGLSIVRARISKSGTGVAGGNFRLHLFRVIPTVANGDNGAFSATQAASCVGSLDINMKTTAAGTNPFSDGAFGVGEVSDAECILTLPANQNAATGGSYKLYGLLEARGAYAPASAETFTVTLEAVRD